jgi:indolepyruvate ferredoxin oxidoreductase beta subunit
MNKSIKIVGVGGQGTILATKIVSSALIDAGYDVKMSEIHGMSQRGGSVSSEIRFGDKVYSPVIEKGHADILVAFEQMEAARYMDYLKPDGVLLINDMKINSMVTLTGKTPYPTDIIETLSKKVKTYVVKATDEAIKLGNAKAMNVVMVGALMHILDMKDLDIPASIKENVKPRFNDLNQEAYKKGAQLLT